MVPHKDMEYHFVEVELGGTYAIQGTVDDVIYNLWGMKEPNYDSTGKHTFITQLGGKTLGLLLRMTKNYFLTGRYVILDSVFCILKGLI